MLPLLLSVKLAVVLACQKSPQPANSGAAASTSLAHPPIFIAAPRKLPLRIPLSGYRFRLSLSC
jgi:hypothetical protein